MFLELFLKIISILKGLFLNKFSTEGNEHLNISHINRFLILKNIQDINHIYDIFYCIVKNTIFNQHDFENEHISDYYY